MKDEIEDRFAVLLGQGEHLIQCFPRDKHGIEHWVATADVPTYQAWLASAANLIRLVARPESHFVTECDRLLTDKSMQNGIRTLVIQKMYGLLFSTREEWNHGLLRHVEYIIAAETFDDFLDHAAHYHKGGKVTESSVLASAVLEDTVKKIAARNNVATAGRTLDPLIDELATAGVLTPVKVKRLKSYAAVRNHALHAEWDQIDIREVGELIRGIRSLIEDYL